MARHEAQHFEQIKSSYVARRGAILALCLAAMGGPAGAQERFAQDAPSDGIAAASAAGPDAAELQPLVDRIVGSAVRREAIPGLIVGVSWHGRRSYFGYSGTGSAAFAPDTIVEIGSITKVFTTALFAEALIEGKMERDAPLQSYLPDRRLKPCTAQITMLQLSDFSSGMPELPSNVPRRLAERGIEHYTSEDFFNWVSHWEQSEDGACKLPAAYIYSNASVGLLGYLVAERLGEPWENLIRQRITGPLRMTSTQMRVPPDQRDRLAQGYGGNGEPVIPWPIFAWYPAGALRSSAIDMLAFGEAALGHETADGGEAVPLLVHALKDAMTPIYQPADNFKQGMAWAQNLGDPAEGARPVFFKAGGTDGFNSVIVINPWKDLAIFIAGNRANAGIPRLGVELSRHVR